MEFQKNDIWVGLFVLVALALVVTAVATVVQGRFAEAYPLITNFESISGIGAGTPVKLRGYQVGEVRDIRFQPDPEVHFEVDFVVDQDVRLKRGTKVLIASTNVIGDNFLNLDISQAAGPLIEPGETLPGESGGGLPEMMTKVNGLLSSAHRTVDRLEEALGPAGAEGEEGKGLSLAELTQAVGDLRELMDNVNRLTTEARPEIAKTGTLVREELEHAQFATAHAGSLMAENRERIHALLAHSDQMVLHLDSLSVVMRGIAEENRDELANIMKEMEKTTANVTVLTEEIARHPWKLLFR